MSAWDEDKTELNEFMDSMDLVKQYVWTFPSPLSALPCSLGSSGQMSVT